MGTIDGFRFAVIHPESPTDGLLAESVDRALG
jgi:hypothetical protein